MFKILLTVLMVLFLGIPEVVAQSAFDDPDEEILNQPQDTGPAGDLVAVQPNVAGGNIGVGANSQVVVLFRNEDKDDIAVQNVQLDPSSNVNARVFNNECRKRPLTPAGECPIIISIQGIQAGSYRVAMVVGHTGRSRFKTANITGQIEANEQVDPLQSELEITPTDLDFQSLTAARPILRSVTLRNISTKDLDITKVSIKAGQGAGFSLNTDCEKLKAGEACIANVIWSPTFEGPASGFLVINHSGLTRVANVTLSGDYRPEDLQEASVFPDTIPGKGLLISDVTSIDFGAGIESTSSVTVTLVNAGDSPLRLRGINLAGSENGLSLSRRGCRVDLVLDPTDACPLTVSWSPSREGQVLDNVQVIHDGARGVLVLPISGEAERAVNIETQAVVRISEGEEIIETRAPSLDGFVITSHSQRLAIISGPGGSRVVRDGEIVNLGGVSWDVAIVPTGVELRNRNGSDQVDLLFDTSLSSRNRASISAEDEFSSASGDAN